MQTNNSGIEHTEQPDQALSLVDAVDELGGPVYRLSALLAAARHEPSDTENVEWLLSMAYSEALELKQRYLALSWLPLGERA
jgi:hypothetical protein